MKKETQKQSKSNSTSRRNFLKTGTMAAAGVVASTIPVNAKTSESPENNGELKNPYGARPGGGISLPEYYKPWPAIKNRNFYAPGTEILPKMKCESPS